MPILRMLGKLVALFRRVSWSALAVHFALLYLFGALVLFTQEPVDGPIQTWETYSWFFVVTVTTVGYGDLVPASGVGKLAAVVIMIFGIGALGVVLGKLGELYVLLGQKRLRGMAELHLSGHIAIFGYRPGQTEQVVDELQADATTRGKPIVLLTEQPIENPMPDRVHFVRGEVTGDEALARACIADAELIVIHRNHDSEAVMTALAVNATNPTAHVVAHVADRASEKHIARISRKIECVHSVAIPLIVQALQDPGVTHVIQSMLSNVDGDVLFRQALPEGFREQRFHDLLVRLNEQHQATLIGLSAATDSGAGVRLNPPPDTSVGAGMALYYIAPNRLAGDDWLRL